MRLSLRTRHLPPRIVTGAFILNSGLSKHAADPDTAEALHGMAAGTYPVLQRIDSATFLRLVSASEITLGAALLVPVVPTGLAGFALAGFSGGLLGLYLRTPGMREQNSLRPTSEGLGLAKDVWMFGIGLSFVVDALLERRSRRT